MCDSFLLAYRLKVTDKVKDGSAVQEVSWVHTHRSLLHQPVLPVLAVHGERLPHHEGGTHYAYDQTGYLTDAAEIEHDHEDEDSQQASCKEEEILCLQALELHRPTYTFVDFPIRHSGYRKKERKIVAATIRKIHAPNQEAAVLLVSGSPLENLL